YGNADKAAAQHCLSKVLETVLKLLAPFAPFITEEINHNLFSKTSIHTSQWPGQEKHEVDETTFELVNALHFIVASARKYRSSKHLSLGQEIQNADIGVPEQLLSSFTDIDMDIRSIARIKTLNVSTKNELFVEFRD
ncbi:class I tRNA ligase family protein, partial [Candidatus Micrarchaeota archaeon]|nr:class I tRNA ligase family protein [Candidatus Micrarchaeota archaeon]